MLVLDNRNGSYRLIAISASIFCEDDRNELDDINSLNGLLYFVIRADHL